jgi:hypothetical protein
MDHVDARQIAREVRELAAEPLALRAARMLSLAGAVNDAVGAITDFGTYVSMASSVREGTGFVHREQLSRVRSAEAEAKGLEMESRERSERLTKITPTLWAAATQPSSARDASRAVWNLGILVGNERDSIDHEIERVRATLSDVGRRRELAEAMLEHPAALGAAGGGSPLLLQTLGAREDFNAMRGSLSRTEAHLRQVREDLAADAYLLASWWRYLMARAEDTNPEGGRP